MSLATNNMNNFSTNDTAAALKMLAETALQRDKEISRYLEAPAIKSDDESDSSSPILDSIYHSGGSQSILDMINFSPREFTELWNVVMDTVISEWNVGRGIKYPYKVKDVLFLLLTVLKHGGKWDFPGQMFKVKGPTFEELIIWFLKIASHPLYETLVRKLLIRMRIGDIEKFKNFEYSRYATGVTFHQTNRPSGNMQEFKYYYSGRHHLYGYKVEASVLPNGITIGFTKHYLGSVADVDKFYRNIRFHSECLRKSEEEKVIIDEGILCDAFTDKWAVLVDKGYQGSGEFLKVVLPKKKQPSRRVSTEDESFNGKVASDRIVVENYFGRFCALWDIMSSKYRWPEELYGILFGVCVSITNFNITLRPFRSTDGDQYFEFNRRLYSIGTESSRKRKRDQENYRQRRRQRLTRQFRDMIGSDDEITQTDTPSTHQ